MVAKLKELKESMVLITFMTMLLSCNHKPKNESEAESSDLYPYYDNSNFLDKFNEIKYRAGYVDVTGKKVIKNQYIQAKRFTEGLGPVSINTDSGEYWGYIDSSTTYKIKPIFEDARSFNEGRALVKHKGKWRIINKKGDFLTDYNLSSSTTDFQNGRCIGYIYKGTTSVPEYKKFLIRLISLEHRKPFTLDVYDVYGIDLDGNIMWGETIVKGSKYDFGTYMEQAKRDYYKKTRSEVDSSLYGFRQTCLAPGDTLSDSLNIIEPQFTYAEDFEHGLARVSFGKKGKQYEKGYINTDGEVIVRFLQDSNEF